MAIAALSAHFGALDRAEAALAEALVALTQSGAAPDNLAGWLVTVGKRNGIDAIRKRDARQRADDGAMEIRCIQEGDMGNVIELPDPISDERLRLIFICCHPALALEARAAELGNVTLIPLFSDDGNFARGDKMKENLPDPLSTYEYFMCGPKPMVDGLMKDLRKEGVSRKKIHTEAFEFR